MITVQTAAPVTPICTTPDCNRPRVSQATNDALSALGLTSTKCDACTSATLRAYIEVAA